MFRALPIFPKPFPPKPPPKNRPLLQQPLPRPLEPPRPKPLEPTPPKPSPRQALPTFVCSFFMLIASFHRPRLTLFTPCLLTRSLSAALSIFALPNHVLARC